MKNSLVAAIVIALIILAASGLGSWVTQAHKDWYRSLQLPSFNPPDYVFPVVWTTIYILFGVATWRMWNTIPHDTRFWAFIALAAANIIFNVSWSYVFFGFHQLWPAVLVSAALFVTIAGMIFAAWPRDTAAAVMLIPYLLWVGFATFLSATIAQMNT